MQRCLFIVLAIVCFACKEQKQPETIVDDNAQPVKAEKTNGLEFEKITFSIFPALGEKPILKM
ncbi:hypothetical protein [Pontibacter fetidus]|uniref:Uncharacterized protein n=1 Tax=Pontibacter fetidus TaxID=2700082 RepID=A0A6B2H699_9BACT|nr:hypothetical protein [Pontibacter fetidus]NDK54712.1 hypothetical protein [Pontibacter fetidus]